MPPKTTNQVNTITTSSATVTTGDLFSGFNPNICTTTTSPCTCTVSGNSLTSNPYVLNPYDLGNTTFKLSPFK